MCELLGSVDVSFATLAAVGDTISSIYYIFLVLLGFSVVVFFHELGHFAVAKWCDVRVERFAVGFGPELFGLTRGETRYSFNIFPLGGYVKMLGQEDFEVDASGEILQSDDPRSFANKTVGQRMAVVSAGVIMNLILAAVLFMIVYMVGKNETSPIVGAVIAETPAARAGLQVGDRIVAIDDSSIINFDQIMLAVRLADPFVPLKFTIERNGELLTKYITPRVSEVVNALQIGIAPKETNVVRAVASEYLAMGDEGPKPGDHIVEVNGTPIGEEDGNVYRDLLMQGRNKASTVVVERENIDGTVKRINFEVPKLVSLLPRGRSDEAPRDVLGLEPRTRIVEVLDKSPADYAEFQEDDIVLRWGNHENPTAADVLQSILEHDGEDIPVTVLRKGELVGPLFYRPVVLEDRQGQRKPKLGFMLNAIEQDRLVVADVVTDPPTPAARSELVKGCEILQINGEPVSNWADLIERFRVNAGSSVQIEYRTQQDKARRTTTMEIPRSISTILDLPPFSPTYQTFNFLLDDQSEVDVRLEGRTDPQNLPATRWDVIQAYLSERVGQTVKVTFEDEGGELVSRTLTVEPDMLDPWYRRVIYTTPLIISRTETYLNRKINPIEAIWAGVKQTHYSVAAAYLTLRRLIFTRSVGVENISGPVGIVHAGSELAKYDKIAMLFFLAFLSANLAVINFLPLPIVDGGLMVFLIIEKIKGSPVSIRTQVVTQIIGIALIGTTFLFVTFNDISKLFG